MISGFDQGQRRRTLRACVGGGPPQSVERGTERLHMVSSEVPIPLELVWASEPWPEAASRYISLKTA